MPVLYETRPSRGYESHLDLAVAPHSPFQFHIYWLCGALVAVAILGLVNIRGKNRENRNTITITTPGSENASYYDTEDDLGMGASPISSEEKGGEQAGVTPSTSSSWQASKSFFAGIPQPSIEPFDAPPRRESETAEVTAPPRRRSYTKTIDGLEVQEEIVVAEGWKRHTRVYGGGVCQACLDSEKKMKLMKAATA
jgi:hypothetical protein